jgi:hypothetical protein
MDHLPLHMPWWQVESKSPDGKRWTSIVKFRTRIFAYKHTSYSSNIKTWLPTTLFLIRLKHWFWCRINLEKITSRLHMKSIRKAFTLDEWDCERALEGYARKQYFLPFSLSPSSSGPYRDHSFSPASRQPEPFASLLCLIISLLIIPHLCWIPQILSYLWPPPYS